MLWGVLAVLAFVFGSVMFSETMSMTAGGWFGTQMNKLETLKFVAFGMGGILAALGAVAINRRASAQVRNNELIEKGHIEERFKSATEGLGNDSSGARIAAFYQFYYLAKDNPNVDFRKNILGILCAHLRDMTRKESYREKEGKFQPTEECQILLNVLFKPEDEIIIFSELNANLRGVYLANADLNDANMQGADLSDANLFAVNLTHANLRGANLKDAVCQNAQMHRTDLSDANLENASLHGACAAMARVSKGTRIHGTGFSPGVMELMYKNSGIPIKL